MNRREFLAAIPILASLAACKPKSKGTFEPYMPEEPEKGSLAYFVDRARPGDIIYVHKDRIWMCHKMRDVT